MFTEADKKRIPEMVFSHVGTKVAQLEIEAGSGLLVDYQNGRARIAAEDRNALARGCFLLARALKKGQTSLNIRQERHIASCGVMADVSRNAVLKVDAVKRLLDKMAMLGLNLLMLYTEDTYEVEGQPYWGYLRGRYSKDELREIDRYAEALDIELVPCIQTLGHMDQFLQWNDSRRLRDQHDILQIDLPDTYQLIETAISGLRSCVRAKRIHVGMDEAHGVGLGEYYAKHGAVDRFELLNRHLKRVCEICRTYDFHPMMWSDMFFRLGSAKNDYYDMESCIPESVIEMIPDVDLVYWDYYHTEKAFYDHMLQEHAKMGRTAFAGGIWTWSGFLPQVKKTWATMRPALKACNEHRVDTVFATLWGDDGAEMNIMTALSQLPIFSEACWQEAEVEACEIQAMGEDLTGIPAGIYQAFGDFYPSAEDYRPGKGLIWCDLLYPLMHYGKEPFSEAESRFRSAESKTAARPDLIEAVFARLCFHIAAEKADVIGQLRDRYLAGDSAYLREVAEARIPELIAAYRELRKVHRDLWERDNKRNGWEVLALRYGAVCGRLEDVQDTLTRYLQGDLPTIAELDEEPLSPERRQYQFYAAFVSPSVDL